MVKFQVRYVDSTGSDQVIAAGNTSKTDSDLSGTASALADRIIVTRNAQGFAKAKVWADPGIIGNVPVTSSEYGTAQNGQSEPEVFIEEWDGSSWVTQFRGAPKSKPSTDDRGQALLVLRGFGHRTGRGPAGVSDSSGISTIVDALQAILPAGYTVDAPAATDWPGNSIPSVDDYTLTSAREVGYQELQEYYDVSIEFTGELSGGDYVVRMDPVGYGGSYDTLYGPNDVPSGGSPSVFVEWESEDTDDIVNDVKVTGTGTDGTEFTGTASDSTSINDYGRRFTSVQVGFFVTQSDVDSISENLLSPDPTSGGEVRTRRYTDRVVNNSFTLQDSNNNVSAEVHTAVKVKDYLLEGQAVIVFEFETGSQSEARVRSQLASERAETLQDGTQSVSLDTGSAPSDTAVTGSVDDDPADTSLNGSVDDNSANDGDPINSSYADNTSVTDQFVDVLGSNVSTGTQTTKVNFYGVIYVEYTEGGAPASVNAPIKMRIRNTSTGETFPSDNGYTIFDTIRDNGNSEVIGVNQSFSLEVVLSDNNFNWNGDNVVLEMFCSSQFSSNLECSGFVNSIEQHGHGDNFIPQDNPHGHGDNFNTSDNQHGGSGDASGQHGASGNVDKAEQGKNDR